MLFTKYHRRIYSPLKSKKTHTFFPLYYSINLNNAHIASAYKPHEVEDVKIPPKGLIGNFPKAKNNKSFSMILPPPNVTGQIHLGHAFMGTIQDVINRRKRQEGFSVTWIPGTDHAGIATQVVVEKKLFKEKHQTRHQIGRKAFLAEVTKWKDEKEGNILQTLKRLGCSLDWEREYFTMDKPRVHAVSEAFVRLFESGIIQRKKTLVNWSCALESAISDIEVETREINGSTGVTVPGYEKPVKFGEMYDVAYQVHNSDLTITISTTRPETILGDVAVAVHPDDSRYSMFRGSYVIHPFRNDRLPIVFDDSVDREFGTGAVKITPAHDKADFELAKRHSLPSVQVFTEKGTIAQGFGEFSTQPRFLAREHILNALANLNLYRGSKSHKMQIPVCSRSHDIIEYMLRPQWFLDCTEMAQQAMDAVRTGRIRVFPSNFEKEWFRWLNDPREWCISRQIWWGHQIPAYFCQVGEISAWVAAHTAEQAAAKAADKLNCNPHQVKAVQDTDVLDTWFSASLLPFSVFGWPHEQHRPLDLMETGHDILFFWVARMVMMALKLTGDVPFRNVLLNGIVCDLHGRKMSKSLGNVILPEQVISGASFQELENEIRKSHDSGILSTSEVEKSLKGLLQTFPKGIPECGTDALRFTLCSYNIKSHYINFDVAECHTNRLFFNKIWQATRYTLSSCEKLDLDPKQLNLQKVDLTNFDRWILSKLSGLLTTCDKGFENYNFHFAVNALRTFFYKNLCDVYLETTKANISKGNQQGESHCAVLLLCLSLGLQAMAPFTPYLSQKLLTYIPQYDISETERYLDKNIEDEIENVLEICAAIRQFKNQNNISRKHEPVVHLFAENEDSLKLLEVYRIQIQALTQTNGIFIESKSNVSRKENFALASTASHLCSFAIVTNKNQKGVNEAVATNAKKLEKLQFNLEKLLNTISSEGYKKSASETVQRRHLEKIKEIEAEISSIRGLRLRNR